MRRSPFQCLRLILLCAFTLAASRVSLAAPSLALEDRTAAPGEEVRLMLSFNEEVAGVCGLSLEVRYEAASPGTIQLLTLSGLSSRRLAPAFANSLYASSGIKNPETYILYQHRRRISIVHGEPVDGPSDVLRLPFKIPADAPVDAIYTVEVTASAFDSAGRKMPIDPALGKVTVGRFRLGDVNVDGGVDVEDAILILRHIVALAPLPPDPLGRADLNGNDEVEVSDAVLVLKQTVGSGG